MFRAPKVQTVGKRNIQYRKIITINIVTLRNVLFSFFFFIHKLSRWYETCYSIHLTSALTIHILNFHLHILSDDLFRLSRDSIPHTQDAAHGGGSFREFPTQRHIKHLVVMKHTQHLAGLKLSQIKKIYELLVVLWRCGVFDHTTNLPKRRIK